MSYVVAHPRGCKKPLLLKATRSGTQLVGIVPDHTSFGEAATVVIKPDDIIVNLGENPPVGTVYNVLVEPVQERLIANQYGEIFSHITLVEPTRTRVLRAFSIALQRVKAMGPPCDWEVRTEVRNPKGLEGGRYAYKPKGVDVLILRPQEGQDGRQLVKVIMHEWAHGVWHRYMDSTARSAWIALYDRYIQVEAVAPRDIVAMIRDMRQIGGVKDFLKDSEPESQKAAEIYLGWLKSVHSMSVREANDMIVSGGKLPIPDTHLHKSDTQTPITLYSKTNAPELFAEALSSWGVKDLADKRMIQMLQGLRNV